MMSQFNIHRRGGTTHVDIKDETLHIKSGLFEKKIPLDAIRYLYNFNSGSSSRELRLLYCTRSGKPVIFKIFAQNNSHEFTSLIDTLAMLRPEADILTKPENEAVKFFKFSRLNVSAAGIVMALVYMLVFIGFLPAIIHGIDTGSDSADIREVAAGRTFRSYNVEIDGVIRPDYAMVETSSGNDDFTVTYYYPVVGPEWTKDKMVYVLLKTPNISSGSIKDLTNPDTPVRGVLRSVFWEGVSPATRDYLRDNIKLDLSPKVRLVEYKADIKHEFDTAVTVLAVLGILFLAVFTALFIVAKFQDRGRKLL